MTVQTFGGGRSDRSFFAALWRGMRRKCPQCGAGKAFSRYLTVVKSCPVCDEPLGHLRADDAPPYFTIFLVGHIIVPPILLWHQIAAPPTWLHLSVWLPVTVVLSLSLLPFVKGATLGVIWALRIDDGPASDV